MTLRRSMLLAVAALTAAALLVVSATAVLALRAYLLDRTDDQLAAAARLARSRTALLPLDPAQRGEAVRQVVSVTEYVIEIRGTGSDTLRVMSGTPLPARPLMDQARLDDPDPQTVAGYRAVVVRDSQFTVLAALSLRPVNDTVRRLLMVAGGTSLGVLLLLMLFAEIVVARRLRPLNALASAATDLADGRLERRVPEPPRAERTEVGRLTLAINGMLSRIRQALAAREQSEQRMRDFVADASHELRTPLTSVRGYLQLVRTGVVDLRDRPDVLGRLEEETARMGSMVDSLLYLARLDASPPAGHTPVDLAALVRDAVADAAAVEPERPLSVEAPGELVVTGDAEGLRRVMANLLANVRAHTSAGTAAHARVVPGERDVRVEVTDEGPGMDAEAAAHAFERFWRAGTARSAAEGAGLGLAIVAEVVRGHGGGVGIDGSTVWFTLSRDS
ncbi:two-component sensor histidine kinase [Paractinoplanes deccanensis]|uniref:histidine kinase n=1 Tax=Paractinoplanes deccanensis TaxID=113561 RepID=A0ABQ3Y857_9ACTN|nr:HAMP domain-containing sensor histidine kinase [Actinoplanes deccanensis]GID76162.1 two-component sensor histidine kinase [Actinoplanes deccanensis]